MKDDLRKNKKKITIIDDLLTRKVYNDRLQAFVKQARDNEQSIIKNYNTVIKLATELNQLIAEKKQELKKKTVELKNKIEYNTTLLESLTRNENKSNAEVAQQAKLTQENIVLDQHVKDNEKSLTNLEKSFAEESNQQDHDYSRFLESANSIALMHQYFTSNIDSETNVEDTNPIKKQFFDGEQTAYSMSAFAYIIAFIASFVVKEPILRDAPQLTAHETALGIVTTGDIKNSMQTYNDSITQKLQSIEVKTIAEITTTNALKPENNPHSIITPQLKNVSERSKLSASSDNQLDGEHASLNNGSSTLPPSRNEPHSPKA